MNKLHLALVGLLMASGLMAQTTPPLGIIEKTPELKAFTGARIYVSAEKSIEGATLVIDRGRIVNVGTNVAIPGGATVTDLTGKTIYPAFIEPFSEYGLEAAPELPKKRRRNLPPEYETDRIGCNAWNGAIHSQENWVNYFQPDAKAAEALINAGFATVQSNRCDGIFRGRSFVTSLGSGFPNDLVILPHSSHCLSFEKGHSNQQYPGSQMGAIALIRQMFLDVDWYQKAHAAYQKNSKQKLPETNLAIEALANIGHEKIIFETGDELALLRADRIAREFGLDVVHVGSGKEYARIDLVKATGRTLIVPVNFPEQPEVNSFEDELDVSLATLRHWDWAPSNPAVLEDNSVTFAFTTHGLDDTKDFLPNVRRAVERGLSRTTALAALTSVPAEICGVGDQVGRLDAGMLADFIVCDGDIFEKETSIYAVYTHGNKTELIPFDETNFGGYYAASLVDSEIGLKLTDEGHGSKRIVEGTLQSGETSITLDNVTHDGDKLTFSAALDSLGSEGIARFSVRLSDQGLAGNVLYADGSREVWTATTAVEPSVDDSTKAESEETDAEEKPDQPDRPIARLTYPNMAYGFETQPVQQNVLIQNGTVWTSEDAGILYETDLLIRNGKIEAVGKNLSAPSDYLVIDATGKHVSAGIIDEHSHVCISHAVNEGTAANSAEVRIGDVVNSDDISVYRSLAGGTTVARLLHGSANPIGGQAQAIKFRWGMSPEEMKLVEAPPSIKFALGENVKQSNWGDQQTIRYPQTRMGVETFIRDYLQTAREYEADWNAYNALGKKQRRRTVPPRKNLRLDALVDILNKQMFITCHSYVQSEILMLMQVAESFDFRITTFTHILEGYKVADEMARHGAAAGTFSDWWAYKFEVYDAIPYNPGLMHQKGVVVSVNSDSRDLQRRLNQEAAKSVQYAGMSQEDAWRMVTINPAKQLKVDNLIGSLKVGKDGDFVIWSGNPLSIYSHAEQTWIEGRKYFDINDDLQARKDILTEKNLLVQKILSSSDENDMKNKKGVNHEAAH